MAQDIPLTSDQIINDVLQNPAATDTIAVGSQRGNNLAEINPLMDDVQTMTYGELRNKYGDDVANNQFRLLEGDRRVRDSDRAERTWGEAISDSAVGAFAGAARTIAPISAQIGAVGLDLIDTDDVLGSRAAIAAQMTSNANKDLSGFVERNTSETLRDKQRYSAIEGQLDGIESENQFQREIEDGADPFDAALRRVGRDAFNAGERTLRDSALTSQVVAEGVGSLVPSAIIAGSTAGLGGGIAVGAGLSARAAQVAAYTGSAIGIGAVEASGTYAETVDSILNLPEEELQASSVYQAMLVEYGGDAARARVELAGLTGETSFARALPSAIALGLITARFEAIPIRSFRGAGVAGGLRTVLAQGVEEAGQGAASSLVGNYTMDRTAGIDTDLSEGVGEAAAMGAIGGIGMAGVTGVPATLAGTPRAAADALSYAAQGAVYTGRVAAKTAGDVATPLAKRAFDTQRKERQSVRDDIQESQNIARSLQGETTYIEDDLNEISKAMDVNYNPSEGAGVAVVAAIGTLRSAYSEIGGEATPMGQSIKKILSNPMVQNIEAKFGNQDQNNTPTPEVITPAVAAETVNIARTQPANVNPETVKRVLEQKNSNYTPEEIKDLRTSAKISTTISKAADTNIGIEENRVITTQKIGEATPKGRKPVDTSRSILADGYVDRQGKSLRSVNDFAADIMSAVQGNTNTVLGMKGFEINASAIAQEFNNFLQHMNNKVGALNESRRTGGKKATFRGLVQGVQFIEASEKTAMSVTWNPDRANATAFAQRVASDRDTAFEVYETLQKAYPEVFEDMDFPQLVALDVVETAETVTEIVAEDVSADAEQTTTQTESTTEDIVDVSALEVQPGETLDVADSLIDYDESPDTTETNSAQQELVEGETDEPSTQETLDAVLETTEQTVEAEPEVDTLPDEEAVPTDDIENEDTDDRNIHESYKTAYIEQPGTLAVDGLKEFGEMSGINPYIQSQAAGFLPRWMARMNKRVANKSHNIDGKNVKLTDALKDGLIQTFRAFRNTAIIDKETGKYNQQLLELSGLAVIDWMLSARPNMLAKMRDSDAMPELTKEQFEDMAQSVPLQQAVETMANDVLRMWNVKKNPDAIIAEDIGIVENVIKEYLTVMADGGQIQIVDLPTIVDEQVISVKGIKISDNLMERQNKLQTTKEAGEAQSIRELLFKEEAPQGYSIGQKIPEVANTISRTTTKLSRKVRTALKNMQDIPHYRNEGLSNLALAMGDDLKTMLGYVDVTDMSNTSLLTSASGKNMSIDHNLADATEVLNGISGNSTPVYYSVGVTSVQRHQYQGKNPQNNKILRALVTPTWSTVNLSNAEDVDAFWLGVAQASDLYKIEKRNQDEILNTPVESNSLEDDAVIDDRPDSEDKIARTNAVHDAVHAKFGQAINIVKTQIQTGELTGNLAEAMGVAEMQQLAAVYAVAQFELAQETGQTSFDTSLSVELDGLTNGAANMMVNFGQGTMTPAEYENLKRVGYHVGKSGASINDYYGDGTKKDLYETVAERAMTHADTLRKKMNPFQRKTLDSAMRFSAHFGDMQKVKTPDGNYEYVMTRDSAKNPMTKVNYGSGIMGVGTGVAEDMVLGFYKAMQEIPADSETDFADFFGYPEIQEDLNTLFGDSIPKNADGGFMFPNSAIEKFKTNVGFSLGKLLAEATHQVLGNNIKSLNDEMVYSTNLQSAYLELLFRKKLEEVAPKDKKGNSQIGKVSRKDFDRITKEVAVLAPIFRSDDQTLNLGAFEKRKSDMELSSNMDDKLRQPSFLPMPKMPRVKAIPYIIIGTGDAMMMNEVYANLKDSMGKTLPIFDGIDMPVNQLKELGPKINEQVHKTWQRDVFGMAVQNFEGFLAQNLDPDLLVIAEDMAREKSKIDDTPDQLLTKMKERQSHIIARKAVFAEIATSTDQMGGSAKPFSTDLPEADLKEINRRIADKLNKVSFDAEAEANEETATSKEIYIDLLDGRKYLNGWLKKNKTPFAKVLKAVVNKDTFGADLKVAVGTLEQINDLRATQTSDSTVITTDGAYDPNTNTIYLTKDANSETFVHEVIHAATMNNVLDHYNGSRKHEAVVALEKLMNEYLSDNPDANVEAAVIRNQIDDSAESKAAALNEFMAWSLSNAEVAGKLQAKGKLNVLGQKVIELIGKLLGLKAPRNMFDEVLMATGYLGQPPVPPNENNGGDGPKTPGEQYTNFWIGKARKWLNDQEGFADTDAKIQSYVDASQDAINELISIGLLRDPKQQATFNAVYLLMSAELPLNAPMAEGLYKIYDHWMENVDPSSIPNNGYGTLTRVLNDRRNTTDALGMFIALTQSSTAMRNTLNDIPDIENKSTKDGSLEGFLVNATGMLVDKLVSRENLDGEMKEIVDKLSKGLLEMDTYEEYRVLRGLTQSFHKADDAVSGAMSKLAGFQSTRNEDIQNDETKNKLIKALNYTVTSVTNMLDPDTAELQAQATLSKMNQNPFYDSIIGSPIRSLVNEIIGMTADSSDLIQQLDLVNYNVVQLRQNLRDKLPPMLRKLVGKVDAEKLNSVFMKTDLAGVSARNGVDYVRTLMNDSNELSKEITDKEAKVRKVFGSTAVQVLFDAQQLGDYMVDGKPRFTLKRNAYAIARLSGKTQKETSIALLDDLISMYALRETDTSDLENLDSEGMAKLFNWLMTTDQHEETKPKTEAARLNHFKGSQPRISGNRTRMRLAPIASEQAMKRSGWKLHGKVEAHLGAFPMGYYVTTTQDQTYSQGVIQNVGRTYRGVDVRSGLTLTSMDTMMGTQDMKNVENWYDKNPQEAADAKDGWIATYNNKGQKIGYEFHASTEALEVTEPETDIFTLAGISYGRQMEEEAAHVFNMQTINILYDTWTQRKNKSEDEFVDLSKSDNPIHKESWNLIPMYLKDEIEALYGKDAGFMVLKNQVDLAVGYRDPSVMDVFSNSNRVSKETNDVISRVLNTLFLNNAKRVLGKGEEIWQEGVSTAKSLIVIRSITVVKDNAISNVYQLINRGVPRKQIVKGTKKKMLELQEFQKIQSSIMELRIEREFFKNPGQRKAVTDRINNLIRRQQKMSVYPLIKAGQFKALVEGLTEQDANNMRDIEGTIIKLADKYAGSVGKNIARYGLISKDTPIYSFMNTATQYGDLIAKSVYFDHLVESKGLSEEEAISIINEEYVNYGLLPGRLRTGMEKNGMMVFFAYKIRAVKNAMRLMRDNPVSTLALQTVGPEIGNPIDDNVFTIGLDRLEYATGPEMLMGAHNMHPWVQIMGWD